MKNGENLDDSCEMATSLDLVDSSASNYNNKDCVIKIEICNEELQVDRTLGDNFTNLNADDLQIISIKTEVENTKHESSDQASESVDKIEQTQLTYTEGRFFKCGKCSFKTTTAKNLRWHYKRSHNIIMAIELIHLSCNKCDYITKDRKQLDDHLWTNHDSPSKVTEEKYSGFKCDECGKICTFRTQLKEHQAIHSDVRPFQCTKCPYKFKTKFNLNRHQLVHKDKSEVQMYTCSKCDYVTKYRYTMQEHELKHVDVSELKTTFPCSMCSYVGKTKTLLKKHQFVHKDISEVSTYKCEFCDFVTKYKCAISKHVRKHNNMKSETNSTRKKHTKSIKKPAFYQCDKCDYMAKSKDILNKHQITHSTLKPFKCDKCPYAGKTKIALVCHRSVHLVMSEVEETFPCDMCKYVGKTKKLLLRHRCIYKNGQKLEILKCNLCSFETIHRRGLSLHKLSHSSRLREKLQCNECDFTSNYESRLKKHQVAHSQERPFQCDKCSYKAKTQFDLKMHLETHQKVGLVKCDICNFPTTRITYLKRHYLKVHKKKLLSSNYNFTNSLEDSDIRNEIMQYSNENSSISEESLDMKFEISNTVIDTNVKSEDDLIVSIKTEPAEAFDEYNKNFGSTSKSLSEEGIDSKTIFQSENNLSNISEAVENSHCEDKFVDASKIHQLLLDDKLIDSSNKDTNITVSHEYNVSIKTEDPDGTLMPGID